MWYFWSTKINRRMLTVVIAGIYLGWMTGWIHSSLLIRTIAVYLQWQNCNWQQCQFRSCNYTCPFTVIVVQCVFTRCLDTPPDLVTTFVPKVRLSTMPLSVNLRQKKPSMCDSVNPQKESLTPAQKCDELLLNTHIVILLPIYL